MKRFLISFLVLAFLFLALPKGVFAATLSLSPSTGTFNKGCPFSLEIVVDAQGAQTDGTDAILMYDSTKFSGESITNGTIYPDFPGNNIDDASGKITISGLASVNTPFSGKGTLATINFTVKETATTGVTQITFEFDPNDKANTTDSNVVERGTIADLLNSVVNGNYTIGSGACGAVGTVDPTPTPYTGLPKTGGIGGTPSATTTTYVPMKTLPEGGTVEFTSMVAIMGVILTVLGVLGLALL